MKKILLLLLVGLSIVSYGQKKEKIKGNRQVLIKKFPLPDFKALKVGEKFEIELKKVTDTTKVIIETDDNLFDVIHFKVEEGVLSFYTSQEIVKKKRLRITIFVPEYFNSIELFEKGKVYNEESLSLSDLNLHALDKGKTDLVMDIKNKLSVNGGNKTQLKMDVTASMAEIYLDEDAQTDFKASFSQLSLSLNDHAIGQFNGESKIAEITNNDKGQFKGENFVIDKASVLSKDKTKTFVNVTKDLDITAKNNTNIFIYNQPKINLKAFEDHAVLYKK